MKIGIDVRPLMQKNYSGVAEYTYQLLTHIFEMDSENEYILFYNSRKNLERYLPEFNYPNVQYKKFTYPNKLLNLSLRFLKYPKLDKLIGGCDLFFCPNVNFASFSSDTKSVIMVHDLSFIRHPEFFDWKHRLWHWLSSPLRLITSADHIIAASHSTKYDCKDLLSIPDNKITVIYEGVPATATISDSMKVAVREKYSLPEKFALYLGTLEPRKNITSIIEAVAQIPDLNLVIAGGNGWKYNDIYTTAQQISDRVHFIGYVDKADKGALYASASVFVWPSFYEGFGLPPLESQAYGTPVIVSANTSLAEVIGDSGLLVHADRVDEIELALKELLSDDVLYHSLQSKGYENVKRFNWHLTAQQTLEVFKKLTS